MDMEHGARPKMKSAMARTLYRIRLNCIAQCPDPETLIDHVIMYLSLPAENAKLRPFFRKDKGALLSSPVLCSVVSAPAVNAGVVGAKSERVMQVMQAMSRPCGDVAHIGICMDMPG